MSRKRRLAYILLTINTVVWGLAAPFVKPALSFIPPERFLFYRFLVASIFSLPFLVAILKRSNLHIQDYMKIVLLELVGTTLILWIIYTALNLTTAIESSFIYSTSPIFVTLAGVFFLRERETKREWKGLLLAFAGTLLIAIAPLLFTKTAFSSGSFIGNMLMLIQNIIWAGYLVAAKKIYRSFPKLAVTSISFFVGVVSFFFLSLPTGNPLVTFVSDMQIPAVAFATAYMAIFGSIIGATTYLVAQNLIEVSEATIFTYAEALVAIPAAMFLLGESVSPIVLVGAIITAIGIFVCTFRTHR